MRVLIIEDDAQIQELVRIILSEEGYEVLSADNGEAGLRVVQKEDVELILMDIIMPDKEGLETIREIRQIMGNDVKIIAMSGGGKVGANTYLDLAQKMGANATIAKPFKREDILDTVAQVMNA